MDKLKLAMLAIAFTYTMYHINTNGWNYGNAAVFAFLLVCIAADFYNMTRKKTEDHLRNPKPRKKK